MEDMKPEDRDALVLKLSAKMKEMTDEELQDLAKELDIDDEPKPTDAEAPMTPPDVTKPVVDTSVLSGPINSLKSFLIKKQQDNDKQV